MPFDLLQKLPVTIYPVNHNYNFKNYIIAKRARIWHNSFAKREKCFRKSEKLRWNCAECINKTILEWSYGRFSYVIADKKEKLAAPFSFKYAAVCAG